MGRRSDRVRVAAAQVSGIAAAYAHVRRIGEGEALAEIAVIVDRLPADRRQKALDQAASTYAAPGQSDLWYPAASRLLERAGADLDTAKAIRGTPGSDLGQLADQ